MFLKIITPILIIMVIIMTSFSCSKTSTYSGTFGRDFFEPVPNEVVPGVESILIDTGRKTITCCGKRMQILAPTPGMEIIEDFVLRKGTSGIICLNLPLGLEKEYSHVFIKFIGFWERPSLHLIKLKRRNAITSTDGRDTIIFN